MNRFRIPSSKYGVLPKKEIVNVSHPAKTVFEHGYALVNSELSSREIKNFGSMFADLSERYQKIYGADFLQSTGELHTMRAPLLQDRRFLQLAMLDPVINIVKELIDGKFYLNQQNGVINPPREHYGQGVWHRDLPYQRFVSDTPLGVAALYCVDDFTLSNGGTFVLPGSHKAKDFPEDFETRAVQIEAAAGTVILMDCMLFHAGGFNTTQEKRRAINNLYTIPYIRQQIALPQGLDSANLNAEERAMVGFDFQCPQSIDDYFKLRA